MAGDNIVEVSDENFQAEVVESEVPVLVDFWAPWCGPCRMVAPVVEAVAAEFAGRLKVAKLNVDENHHTAADYGIMSIPTLLIFKDGQVRSRLVGYRPKGELVKAVETVLGASG